MLNREAVLNLPVFIHKIHMGNKLKMTGGTYAGLPEPYETTYPAGRPQLHQVPPRARAARRSLEDAALQPGLRRLSRRPQLRGDAPARPRRAHRRAAGDRRRLQHLPPGGQRRRGHRGQHTSRCPLPTPATSTPSATGNGNTNAAYVAAAGAVPAGAKVISYVVDSVSTWTDAAAGNVLRPQIVFKFKLDGTDVVFPNPATAGELIPSFVGSPSAYFVFAVPQDGKAAPADFNASASAYIKNIWNGTGTCSNAAATTTRTGAGTLTGPDAMGFYTLRLTCATIPANATMLTGGIGYTYALGSRQSPANPDLDFINNTMPLTQIDLPAYPYVANKKADGVTPGYGGVGGLIVPPPDVSKVATGFTGRRAIVDNTQVRRRATCRSASGPTSTPASATTRARATGVTAPTRPAAPGRPTRRTSSTRSTPPRSA